MRPLVTVSAILIAIFIALIAGSLFYMRWEIQHLDAFCNDLKPGTPVSQIPQLAEKHGILGSLPRRALEDKERNEWILLVPAVTTMGDVMCVVHHNNVVVVSAKRSHAN